VDSELRTLERALLLEGDERGRGALERARLRAGVGDAASLHDFLQARANAAALELVGEVAARRHAGHVFLDGPTGTGKTHLLRALSAARADALLTTGVDLDERAARAIEANELLDLPRLTIVDDLLRFGPLLGALLARSLRGRTLVAAGPAAREACEALTGRFVLVGPLDEGGRLELLRRRLAPLALDRVPDPLPSSGFEIAGLAHSIELRART